jgi:hypothetical protein
LGKQYDGIEYAGLPVKVPILHRMNQPAPSLLCHRTGGGSAETALTCDDAGWQGVSSCSGVKGSARHG